MTEQQTNTATDKVTENVDKQVAATSPVDPELKEFKERYITLATSLDKFQ